MRYPTSCNPPHKLHNGGQGTLRLDPRREFRTQYGMRQGKLCIAMFTLICLADFSAAQQSRPATSDRSRPPETSRDPVGTRPPGKPSTQKPKESPSLADATRVSTADAARKAAKDLAKDHGSSTASDASGVSDVLEFHAASPDGQGAAATKEPKKSALKNVHGDAYGAFGGRGATKEAGGSVGATSKSGKTSISVQTDRSHETAPTPH